MGHLQEGAYVLTNDAGQRASVPMAIESIQLSIMEANAVLSVP